MHDKGDGWVEISNGRGRAALCSFPAFRADPLEVVMIFLEGNDVRVSGSKCCDGRKRRDESAVAENRDRVDNTKIPTVFGVLVHVQRNTCS